MTEGKATEVSLMPAAQPAIDGMVGAMLCAWKDN